VPPFLSSNGTPTLSFDDRFGPRAVLVVERLVQRVVLSRDMGDTYVAGPG
jgi:hypothetical protein